MLILGLEDTVGDSPREAVGDCVELLDAEGAEAVRSAVKLPTGVADTTGLLEAELEGLHGPVKLCRVLGDSPGEAVGDCVELLDAEGAEAVSPGVYVRVTLGLNELLEERDAQALTVFPESDFSAVGVSVTLPLRVPLIMDETLPDRVPLRVTERDTIELLDAVAAAELVLDVEADGV